MTGNGCGKNNRSVESSDVVTIFSQNQTSPDIDPTQKTCSEHCQMAMSNTLFNVNCEGSGCPIFLARG